MLKNQTKTVGDEPKVTVKSEQQTKPYKVELYKTDDLIPYDKNPRKISDKAIKKVASSIKEFGFLNKTILS